MIAFAGRNLKVFFKDKASVFFSLLSVFIIIGLYALFLGDIWLNDLEGIEGAKFLMNSWIMAGLLSVTSITTTMGAFGIMVDDKANKISKDFVASPIKNSSIAGGYILSSFTVGTVMSLVTLVLAELYIVLSGGELLSLMALVKVLGLILLSSAAGTALVLLLVSFFSSQNALATASTIIGTLIGFVTGIYLPVGQLPEGVQMVIKCFPVSHSASLFRQVMMEKPLGEAFAGAPPEYAAEFEQFMGVTFRFGDTEVTRLTSILVLLATTVVFFGLALMNMSRKRIK